MNNYAFIDSQNVNLGVSQDIKGADGRIIYRGWKLGLKKFRIYLSEKYNVSKAHLFLGYIKQNEQMYTSFREYGFELIFKEVTTDFFGKPKGNVDAELVLQSAAIDYSNYDKAVIVTGDGDFKCLIEFLASRNKFEMLLIPNQFIYSRLLRKPAGSRIAFLNRAKNMLELDKKWSAQHKH